jgi:hypothetical protein
MKRGKAVNVEATNVSWTDTLQSFETIRCFLRANKLKTVGFEQVVESISLVTHLIARPPSLRCPPFFAEDLLDVVHICILLLSQHKYTARSVPGYVLCTGNTLIV